MQYPFEFVNSVFDFYKTLGQLYERDPDQELQGSAIHAYNQIISDAKILFSHNEYIQTLPEVINVQNIENILYPRVADTMVVISQIWSALGTGKSLKQN
jgi:hypothetical protein